MNEFYQTKAAYMTSDTFYTTVSVLKSQIEIAERIALESLTNWRDTRDMQWLRFTIQRYTALASLYNALGNITCNSTYLSHESQTKKLLRDLNTTLIGHGWVL